MIALRPYQSALIGEARAALSAGVRRLLIQSSTGSGKTMLAAQMLAGAAARGRRSWFCVHRRELLDQSAEKFIESADLHVGIVGAGSPMSPLAPVQVCSVPSLARRLERLQPPDLIVWDECHHIASRTWADIAARFPDAVHLGLTATPQRLDGRGLGAFFDRLLCGPSTADLTAAGYLAPYRFFAPGSVDLSRVHHVAGEFNRGELSVALDASTVVGDAVRVYQQQAAGGQALVFVWALEASRRIAEQFTAAGIPAAHVDGETPKPERQAALAAFRSGALRVLCNVDLFGEGLDVPAVDAVFLLRPTESLGLYLQQVGRGLRPALGKDHVKVFDHVDNWRRHGLPDAARAWTLEDRPKKARDAVPAVRRCGQCFAVLPAAAVACGFCGAALPIIGRHVHEVAGELHEVDTDILRLFGAPTTTAAVRVCQGCSTGFTPRAGSAGRFCSSACYLRASSRWKRKAG